MFKHGSDVPIKTRRAWRTIGTGEREPSAGARPEADLSVEKRVRETLSVNEEDYSPDLVFILARDGKVLFVNRTIPGSDEDPVGSPIYNYMAEDDHETIKECLHRAFDEGKGSGFEGQGLSTGDPPGWYQYRISPNRREGKVVSASLVARNITARKKVEDDLRVTIDRLEEQIEALESSRAHPDGVPAAPPAEETDTDVELLRLFRNVMDQAGEAIFITDARTGRFVDLNETACSWLRSKREKLIQKSVKDVDLEFPLQLPELIDVHVTNTRDHNRPQVFDDGLHRRRNGTSFPVEVSISRLRFNDADYYLAIARDIKARKSKEETLKESDNRFRALFELSRDAIYLSARDGTIVDVNDAMVDLFGYTRGELLGLRARQLYRRQEDIQAFQERVASDGFVKDLPVEFLTKEGQVVRGLLAATLRKSGDQNILGYQCIIRELADRERAPRPTRKLKFQANGSNRADGSVLVVEPEDATRSQARIVLERAGIPVLTASTWREGIEVLRQHGSKIEIVLLESAADVLEDDEGFRNISEKYPDTDIVLLARHNQVAVERADTRVAGVIKKPLEPLALVQNVRETLKSRQLVRQLNDV